MIEPLKTRPDVRDDYEADQAIIAAKINEVIEAVNQIDAQRASSIAALAHASENLFGAHRNQAPKPHD